jgi:hypothetical protein
VTKLGLLLEDVSSGIGAKIAAVDPHGKAAKVSSTETQMRLSSINGERCRDLPFERIMAHLRDLSPSAPIQLEMEATSAAISGASEEVSKPKPMRISVNCAPERKGGECSVVPEVQLTLAQSAARAVTWKRGGSIEEEGSGLPRVSVLICAIFLPAAVILALGSVFSWYADMSKH